MRGETKCRPRMSGMSLFSRVSAGDSTAAGRWFNRVVEVVFVVAILRKTLLLAVATQSQHRGLVHYVLLLV